MRHSNFRLKTIVTILFAWALLFGAYTVNAQPAAMPAPKPMVTAMPAPMPVAMRPAPRPAVKRAVMAAAMPAPKPAPMPAEMDKPAVAPMEAAMAASMEATKPEPVMAAAEAPKAKGKSADSQAAFWLGILVTPVLLLVLGILARFKLLEWTKGERAKLILGYVRDGAKAFVKYAEGTKAEWDDAVAKLIDDISGFLVAQGQAALTEEEKYKYKAAAHKAKDIVGPDKQPEEKKSVEKTPAEKKKADKK